MTIAEFLQENGGTIKFSVSSGTINCDWDQGDREPAMNDELIERYLESMIDIGVSLVLRKARSLGTACVGPLP